MLELRALSRPRVTLDGEAVTGFISDKALALLWYLALHEGRRARKQLAGLLWGKLPEKRARGNLRVALHNLNQLLPGYLDVSRKFIAFAHDRPHWIDVNAFTAKARAGDPQALAEAIDLYAGDFLAGLYVDGAPELADWLRAEQERLRLRLIEHLDCLAGHYGKAGRWAEAEHTLRRLLAVEPWREQTHRELMRALAHQGSYAAALAQYEACCRVLDEELAVAPMPETDRLYARIRRLRQAPRPNLPTPDAPLIGREKEVADVEALLAGNARLVSIVGPGGMGKTRLALEVARRSPRTMLRQVVLVDLAPLSAQDELLPALARALKLEIDKADRDSLRRLVLKYLAERELLLVLDNFEHLSASTGLLQEMLRAAPGLKLLVTSRERLKLRAEHVYPLGGFARAAWSTLEEAGEDPALSLFRHHARRVRPSFTLRSDHLPDLRRILELTGGMPLALILAGGWTAVLSPAEIAAGLARGLDLLAATHRDVPPRQRSVRAVFAATWERLTPREQRIFAAVSVFRGGFTADAARAVAGATPADLLQLVNRSLLSRLPGGRFAVHELLRQFAAEQLDAAGRAGAAREAHSTYYIDALSARLPDLKGRDQVGAAAALAADFDNVRAAWHHAVSRGRWASLPSAIQSLYLFAHFRSRHLDVLELLEALGHIAGTSPHPHALRAPLYALAAAIDLRGHAGALTEALNDFPQLEALIARNAGAADAAFCQLMVGRVYELSGRLDQAVPALEAAADHFRQTRDTFFKAFSLLRLAGVYGMTQQLEESLALSREGLQMARAAGDRFVAGGLYLRLGGIVWQKEGPSLACERYYVEAARQWRELGCRTLYAVTLSQLATIPVWREGNVTQARAMLEEALAIAVDQADDYARAQTLAELNTLRLIDARYKEALAATVEIQALVQKHEPLWQWVCMQRGAALLGLGDVAAAVAPLCRGAAGLLKTDYPTIACGFLPFFGMILARRGDKPGAVELLARGLTDPYNKGRLQIDPLITQLHADLKAALDEKTFAAAWERGRSLDPRATTESLLAELDPAGEPAEAMPRDK